MAIKLGIIITSIFFRLLFGAFGCDHVWQDATCVTPATCTKCGETQGELGAHTWLSANCTSPQTCKFCGITKGEVLDHVWMDATFSKPQTCISCGITTGDPLAPNPAYINEMQPIDKFGKLWSRSEKSLYSRYHTRKDQEYCWGDLNTPGQTIAVVKDNMGNVYSYGLHLDGEQSYDYYVSYELQGAYESFSGTCAFPGIVISETFARRSSKQFYIYGDDELLYASPTMSYNSMPQAFEIDVTGVNTLKILYPATTGVNEAATLFDGCLTYRSSNSATNSTDKVESERTQTLQDGEYYGSLNSWNTQYMTIELLQYAGRSELSYNYMLNPTGQSYTLDISQAETFLEYAWSEDYIETQYESIDTALNTKLWGSSTTVREYLSSNTFEIFFTVKNGAVKKIVILYAA